MDVLKSEILIFKANPNDSEDEEDPFKKKLQEEGYSVRNIPVLEFEFCGIDALENDLRNPDNFSGLIFTSPRGVKAVTHIQGINDLLNFWRHLPVFVIGEGTAKLLKTHLDIDGHGSDSGNANALADVILQDKYEKPFLFPCGNLKRDVLATRLSEGGINLKPLTVYRTKIHQHLESNIEALITEHNGFPEVVVYFSPSGVNFTYPVLQRLGVPLDQLQYVAIGPATEEALREFKLKINAVASKPTPEHLLHAIIKCTTK